MEIFKMFKTIFLVVIFGVINSGNCESAPFIKKCKWNDSKCIRQSTQDAIPIVADGIPGLGVEKLDPFHMDSLNASSPGLKLQLNDITGTGLKNCRAENVKLNNLKSRLFLKLLCTVDFAAQYDMQGKILILPIEGKGQAHLVLRKVEITTDVDLDHKLGRDGRMHWSIKDWRHSYILKDKSTIELENLFNGNEVLGRAARELISSSSNEILTEVGPPIIKGVVAAIVDNVKNLLKNVPIEELSDN